MTATRRAGPHLAARRLRALAIGRDERLPSLPDVLTLREAGFPDIDRRTWFGLFAPAATPPAIIRANRQAVAQVMAAPDFDQRFVSGRGMTGYANSPEASAEFIRRDLEAEARPIRISGARVG